MQTQSWKTSASIPPLISFVEQIIPPTLRERLSAALNKMMGLVPLWMLMAWMVFPFLDLMTEFVFADTVQGADGVAKLRPWPAAGPMGCNNERKPCFLERPAWHDDRPAPGRILFVSVGFHGHAMPLLALAEEMAQRGHNVTFSTHTSLRTEVEETPGVAFLSAGRMPMHEYQLRTKLRSLSQSGGFWGLLTLLNDVYLPLARPMYRNLLAAVSPPTPSPMPSSAPEGPDASSSWRARKGPPSRGDEVAPPPGGAVVGGGAFSKAGASAEGSDRVPGEVGNDQGVRGGEGDHCVESDGGGGSAEGSCDAEALGNGGGSSDVLSAAATGEGSERGVVASDGVASTASAEVGADTDGGAGERRDGPGRGNGSSWAPPPFDLVVVDMGSLAGLDFAQKLGIPYMFNSPSLLFDLSGKYVSATLPAWGTGMGRRMTLGERLQNAISPRAFSVFLTPAFFSLNKARREHGLEPLRAQDGVFHGARILVNTVFGLEYPHELSPLVEMTGPLLPPRTARVLSPPLPRLDNSTGAVRKCVEPTVVSPSGEACKGKEENPLALPFLVRTWLESTGALVAPGSAAFGASARLAASARQRAEAVASMDEEGSKSVSGASAGVNTETGPAAASSTDCPELYPTKEDDKGVIYVNLGRMPQLEKWQLVTVLQALSSPGEVTCWRGVGDEDEDEYDEEDDERDIGGDGDLYRDAAMDRLGRYRVLWMLPLEQREKLLTALLPAGPPSSFRLKVLGGLSHLGILAHPNVKAVVSHCGMGAAQEALLFGKPLLCVPILADQEDVARRVSDAGAGLSLPGLPTGNVSSLDMRDAMADLVTDPGFRGNAQVLSGVLRRAGGTFRAADVVEGTLQLGGGSHLHPPELRGPWHKTTSTDTYVLFLAVVILLGVLGHALLAAICYAALLVLRAAVRSSIRFFRWSLGLTLRRLPRLPVGSLRGGGRGEGGRRGSRATTKSLRATARDCSRSPDRSVAAAGGATAAAKAAAAAAAAATVNGGLWNETMMALLGGPGPPDPFPEDSLRELDWPAIDRQPIPKAGCAGGRRCAYGAGGGGGSQSGSNDRGGSGSGGLAGGGGGGPGSLLRSLSGDLVVWPNPPNEGRTLDFHRGWSNGGGGVGDVNDVSPHHGKRWD